MSILRTLTLSSRPLSWVNTAYPFAAAYLLTAREIDAAWITFENETLDEAYASRAHYGAEPWQVEAWVSTYTAIADGSLATVTRDVEHLTGHPARGVAEVFGN